MLDSAPLVFALAMLAGVLAQALGRHFLVPGIVILLGLGVLLGPDVADVIRPRALGPALDAIVGFSVAVIMFEGGMRLEAKALRAQLVVIRRLITLGAVITAVGAAAACRIVMGWDLRLSILFGTLVIVTGPTVIGPLVRRIRLAVSLATILEAEGVFVDAVGAMIAITALELALAPSGMHLAAAAEMIAKRIGVGVSVGVTGGLVLAALLRVPRLVPRGLENVLALAAAVALYQLSHGLVAESGIPAAIAAGMVVGNMRIHRMSELVEFKEQLTSLLIGTLFVLLAADIRIAGVAALGWRALAVVAVVSLVVRPVTVLVCTAGTKLGWREKLYMSWIAPRGIVAAAVASLFASHLAEAHLEGGLALRALVFTVIAVTVTVQGLSAGPLARLLGLRRTVDSGYVFLGANPLARHLATRLAEAGEQVELIDSNPGDCRAAQEAGLKVIFGNGLEHRTLLRARADTRAHAVALTTNEGVNLLFAQHVLDELYGPHVHVAVDPRGTGVVPEMVQRAGAHVLFGRAADLHAWVGRFRRGLVDFERRRFTPRDDAAAIDPFEGAPDHAFLALLVDHKDKRSLADAGTKIAAGDIIELAIAADRRADAEPWLAGSSLAPLVGDEAIHPGLQAADASWRGAAAHP
jgi:NhaP-type Na+/H+ or K+/H+ antiporter